MSRCDTPVMAILAIGLLLPADLPAVEQADPAVQQLQLELATLYERLHDWEKAETQLLAATNGPSGELRRRALAGIEQVRKKAKNSNNNSSLKLGAFYARQGMWSEAEKHYLDAAKDSSEATQKLALQGLKHVRDQMPRSRLAEDFNPRFDIFSGLISRGLAIFGVAILALAIYGAVKIRRRIEVLPFVASSEVAGAQIIYWLSHSQAMVQSVSALHNPTGVMGPSILPYLQLPGLAEQLPELGEIAVVAGVKVPAGELLKRLSRPRVRVSGGWITDAANNGRAFAEFKRRRGFSRYESYVTIKRDIPSNRQDQELELFAYDILIKAAETYVA